ncbi:MAG: cytochrome B [Betaproteobacteria bacterium RIFCSPLOWO2_02_FULL_66_14]|nr:MAG: cytochrome B [Betaproteobacteria bacterium RIFCSPLOWO2_02_FULL_66_14]
MPRIYVHPLPVRIWHWINALAVLALIVTGIQIRYVGLIDLMSFRTSVVLHNWVGFVLIGNFFVWLLFYLLSDKIRVYHPELSPTKHFRESFRQLWYYGYGIFKGEPNPHHVSAYHKFNAMQSMAYQVVMLLLVPLQFYTGVLLWDVKRFEAMIDVLGGVRVVDTAHVLIFIFFTAFIFVHPYLASLGHTRTAHYKAMITGYEEVEEEPPGGGAGSDKAGSER